MAVAALLTGCAPTLSAGGPTAAEMTGAAFPPVMTPLSPGTVYELPDPGFDGYDARGVWSTCLIAITERYPQLAPNSDFDYKDFELDSLSMPGSAPIDFTVRMPMLIRNTAHVGTMVCYVGGGGGSPYVAAIGHYGFNTK